MYMYLKQTITDSLWGRDGCWILQYFSDFRIQMNIHILLLFQLRVPSLNLHFHPVWEGLTNDSVYHRWDIFTMQFFNFSRLVWQALQHIRICLSEQKHMLNAETFVPRSLKNLDFLTCYSLAFSTYQITQMEHSHNFELVEVTSAFTLEEAVYLYDMKI